VPYNDSRLNTGKMRHRLELVNPGTAYDETGGISLANTSPVATVWGRIEAVTGRDALAASQFDSLATYKITVRYNELFTAKMQVWFRGRAWQVLNVLNPDQTNKTMVLLCVEVNDSAQQVTNQPGGLS
jgi:SPP1 family predicted phage head-tail adaptor